MPEKLGPIMSHDLAMPNEQSQSTPTTPAKALLPSIVNHKKTPTSCKSARTVQVERLQSC